MGTLIKIALDTIADSTDATVTNSGPDATTRLTLVNKGTDATIRGRTTTPADGAGYLELIPGPGGTAAQIGRDVSPTRSIAYSVKFRLPGSLPTNTTNFIQPRYASGPARTVQLNQLGQILIPGTTSSPTGIYTTNVWYRAEYVLNIGTVSGQSELHFALYNDNGTTPIYTADALNQTLALEDVTTVRIGRLATQAGDTTVYHIDSMQLENDWTTFIGPWNDAPTITVDAGSDQIEVEPWTTVTLSAVGVGGIPTWTHVSGPNPTLNGGGATVTFTAPPAFDAATSVFRASVGATFDNVSVTYLPATDGIVTSANPLTVTPIRFTRKTS